MAVEALARAGRASSVGVEAVAGRSAMALTFLLGCAGHAPSAAPPALRASEASMGAPASGRLADFDCFELESIDAVSGRGTCSRKPAMSHAPSEPGLRGWRSGGPLGAAWNAGDLDCRLRLELGCDTERLDVSLKVARTELGRVQLAAPRGQYACDFPIAHRDWSAQLDPEPTFPVETALFRIEAFAVCKEVPDVVRLDDQFVAGFGSGE